MANEWRVSVSLPKRSRAKDDSPWQTAMSTLRGRIGSDISVSLAPKGVFLYAGSAHAATQTEHVVREVLAEHNVSAGVRCDRWNPISESWTSHEQLMNSEREKSAATGLAAWQVRVEPPSHAEVKALARRLEVEGLPVARRWKYLIAGAGCEDDARALADQIQGYSSIGTRIRVQTGVYGFDSGAVWTTSLDQTGLSNWWL